MRNKIATRSRWPKVGKVGIAVYIICLLLPWAPLPASAASIFDKAGGRQFLPVNKAFRLSASWEGKHLSVRWYVMPGYYLYRNRLGFSASNASLGKPELPSGEVEQDAYFGKVAIYRDELLVNIPVIKAGKSITLEVHYQGCADAGYCYPPQKRTLKLVNLQ